MRYFRKIIVIRAEDSPNVRLALRQQAAGLPVTGEQIVPGVLTWEEYQKRRAVWDRVRQTVGLDAEFFEGAELLLFPPEWLNRAETVAAALPTNRKALAIGIDPAEGGDKTAMTATDEYGIIEQVSRKTPDTSLITGEAIAFMLKHQVNPENVIFDRGGGGKEHADRLRAQGYNVRTVAFGESIVADIRRGYGQYRPYGERLEEREEKYRYVNRRSQLYGEASLMLDPSLNPDGYGIPAELAEMRRQLSVIPKDYDAEGRLSLTPKDRNPGVEPGGKKRKTLVELIGNSPDEADSWVLSIYGMLYEPERSTAGISVGGKL